MRLLLSALCALILSAFTTVATFAAGKPADVEVTKSARSGLWSAPATWSNGQVPADGARVMILPAHVVTYDVSSEHVIRCINVAGALKFTRDKSTLLNVGLLKIEANDLYCEEGFDCEAHIGEADPNKPRATLEVGTANAPLPADRTAMIRLHAVPGLDKKSCPAIVCCGGRMDFHGAPLNRTWLKLGATARKGDATVTLAEPVTGWKVGDKLILTATQSERGSDGTRRPGKKGEEVFTEERTLKAIDGAKLTLDEPLKYEHLGEGETRGEVANLSRNVVVESADPAGERGHTMYHRGSAGSIGYAEFRHLGKENVLGRYSLHFHLVGNTMRGSSVIGASIWDSHNRWLTIHGTNYLLVRDCVGYQSVGHGYYLEDGTEVYNILDRNLAVQSYHGKKLPQQILPFDDNEGAGFWWANSLNTFTRNVACENDRYGFRFEATATRTKQFDIQALEVMRPDGTLAKTDVRTLPFVRFADNECHCDGLYGINLGQGVNRVGPDAQHPFVLKNTKIWQVHYAFRPQSPCVLVENMLIDHGVYGVYHPNYDRHVYRDLKILFTEAEPFNRGHDDDSIQYGPLTVDGLEFSSRSYGGQMPFIQMTDDNPTGLAVSHFRNVRVTNRPAKGGSKPLMNLGGGPRPTPKTEHGVAYYLHDWYGPGKTALVASVKAKDLLGDGAKFKADTPLTGDESRVSEVSAVEFPIILHPVDDLPPQTVITSITVSGADKINVQGVVADNGDIRRVVVNGQDAKLDPAVGQWQVTLPRGTGKLSIAAHSIDAAGNTEKLPHQVVFVGPQRRAVAVGSGLNELSEPATNK